MKTITWKSVEYLVSKIKPTPNNFKLKTEDGLSRFKTSTKNYGRAGTIILNLDGTIIDGNTRWEEAKENGEKKINVSIPSRLLTKKEFTEFSAMYDLARAGEVDVLRIKNELGDSKAWFKKWGMEMPEAQLKAIEELERAEGKVIPSAKKEEIKKESLTKPMTLMFTAEQNAVVIKKAESLYAKYKVDNVTDLVYKIFTKL